MDLLELRWCVSHSDRQAANRGCRRGKVRLVTFNGKDAICREKLCKVCGLSAWTRGGDEITEPDF